jgi:hypothetical protein
MSETNPATSSTCVSGTCDTCAHWQRTQQLGIGNCIALPPQLVVLGTNIQMMFPPTPGTLTCGLHLPVAPKAITLE